MGKIGSEKEGIGRNGRMDMRRKFMRNGRDLRAKEKDMRKRKIKKVHIKG